MILIILLIFAIAKTQAQDYQINFTGTGASTIVDSVKVENLTQCTGLSIYGNDTLHLTAVKSVINKLINDKNITNSNFQALKDKGNMKILKSTSSIIDMQYNAGDRLKLTGFSEGLYSTVNMLVPTQTQSVNFNFITCTDADSNHYAIVQIGSQIWMAENLKTTKYRNNDPIPNVTDSTAWMNHTSGAYCDYDTTPGNSLIYGKLYNWYAVADSRNLCPIGWHVPADTEWLTLANCNTNIVGGKLKEICMNLWEQSPIPGGNNESGFTALPGGYRDYYGSFYYLGYTGSWWSSTEVVGEAWYRLVSYNFNDMLRNFVYKQTGFSVRCVKD